MKKRTIALLLAVMLLLLAACKAAPKAEGPDGGASMVVKVIEVHESSVLAVGSGVAAMYTIGMPRDAMTGIKGEALAVSDLRPGMVLSVAWDGLIAESYPGQFSAAEVTVVTQQDDLVGLYLRVLLDLWETDPALNSGVQTVGVDFSGLSDLDAMEREALKYVLSNALYREMGMPVNMVSGTWEALCEQGYIDREELSWEDGVFLSLALTEREEGKVTFDARKWRSGTGAIWFKDCTADRGKDGQWNYEMGSFAIS